MNKIELFSGSRLLSLLRGTGVDYCICRPKLLDQVAGAKINVRKPALLRVVEIRTPLVDETPPVVRLCRPCLEQP